MNRKYLVKLTPHDKYFFGGETTFGEGNDNYFVKSNYFPQQTSLLGLVRYQLLQQSKNGIFKNNKIVEADKAAKLIGEESYRFGNGFNFGAIKNLSPVFITDENGDNYFPANKEYQWVGVDKATGNEINNFVFRQFNKNEKGSSVITTGKDFIPKLEGYEAKDGLPDLLIDRSSSIRYYDYKKEMQNSPFNGVFIEHRQAGIRKNYKGKSEDKAYYTQVFYKLLDGYSFAFIVELDDSATFESQSIVTLGGEQSKYKMEVVQFTGHFDELLPVYEQSVKTTKVVLVSDTYTTKNIFDVCEFAITEAVDFRCIKSSVNDTKNYAAMSESKTDVLNKSDRYSFFNKGSVFYGNADEISRLFDEEKALKNLGYNHYKIINKKS